MKTLLELNFPLESGLMTTVRLAASGICSLLGLDLEAGEDCKVCVTESLLLLKHRGYAFARVSFYEKDGLFIRVAGEGEGKAESAPEDDISLALLGALLGDMETEMRDGQLYALSFTCGKQA